MSLIARVQFRSARYDAALADRVTAEWPPHPHRLFCALVSAARSETDDAALRWLEGLGSPRVHARPEPLSVGRHHRFVVVNQVEHGKHQQYPARRVGAWQRAGTTVPADEFAYSWDIEPDDDTLAVLTCLGRRVPYLGRSTTPVVVTITAGPAPEGPAFLPADRAWTGATELRVPYPGYLSALRAAHTTGGRAWEVSRSIPYRRPDDIPISGEGGHPHRSAWAETIVLGFDSPRSLTGALLPRVTGALRRFVMARTRDALVDLGQPEGLPPAVHGHRGDLSPTGGQITQLAYLALPFVGFEHADGRLSGVAVCLPPPAALNGPARQAVLRAVLGAGDGPGTMPLPGDGRIDLVHDPYRGTPATLLPQRWTDPARTWISATPLVPDMYPKRGDWSAAVARSVRLAGLPAPSQVTTSVTPLLRGAPRIDTRELPARDGRPPLVHTRLDFDQPVEGPVLIGRLRHLGLGLCAPVRP